MILDFMTLMRHTSANLPEPKVEKSKRRKLVSDEQILDCLSRKTWRTADTIAQKSGISAPAVRKRMDELIAQDLVVKMSWRDNKKVKHVAFLRSA